MFSQIARPCYQTPEPNAPVRLYEGKGILQAGDEQAEAEVTAEFRWLPTPLIVLECISKQVPDSLLVAEQLEVTLAGFDASLSCQLMNLSTDDMAKAFFQLVLEGQPTILRASGAVSQASYAVAHIANFFPWVGVNVDYQASQYTGLFVLQDDEWRITINGVPDADKLISEARKQNGYAITHVARIERQNEEPLEPNTLLPLAGELYLLLSFARGGWVSVAPLVLFSASGEKVGEIWGTQKCSAGASLGTWFLFEKPTVLQSLFPVWRSLCKDTPSEEALTLTTDFYVIANRMDTGLEVALVVAAAALEMLSYYVVVEKHNKFSEECFDRKKAADRIAELLGDCGIPDTIPSALATLSSYVRGSEAIVRLRNGVVHMKPSRRREIVQASPEPRYEALKLALRYIELVILRLLNYAERYKNRCNHDLAEFPPWIGREGGAKHGSEARFD